jgi:L-threonylcarbamoyladenylate synthase
MMAVVLRVDARSPEPAVIAEAARMIRDGLIVAYPTDTLYGLAVDPRNPAAVQRLFALKGRPETSAFTLIAADLIQARLAARLTPPAEALARQWWPGPLTIVVLADASVTPAALAGGRTVGVRVPHHTVAVDLARATGFCITATSANRSGESAPASPDEVLTALPGVDAILDAGAAPGGAPSTIVGVLDRDVTLIRAGAVPWERVLRSLT